MLSHTGGLGQLQEYEILCRAGPVGSDRGSREAGRFLEAGTGPGARGVLWEASPPGRTYLG